MDKKPLTAEQWIEQVYERSDDLLSYTEVIDKYAQYYHSQLSKWVSVNERTPSCFMSGNWDGLKSEPVLAQDKDGKYYVAIVYKGILDGNKFCDWYDIADFEINSIVKWQPITP